MLYNIRVNKHQLTAVAVAILAIVASLILWTRNVDKIDFPDLSLDLSESIEKIVNGVVGGVSDTAEVSVKEVEVENLGDHFVERVDKTHVEASLIADTQRVEVQEEVVAALKPTQHVDSLKAEPVNTAVEELKSWQLSRAWGISIPSLSIRAPVLRPSMTYWSNQEWQLLEEQMQVGLNHGAVAYPHSTSPGMPGSLIIAGHSSPPTEAAEQSKYGHLFARLPDIELGKQITVETNGTPIVYEVEEKFVVSPRMTSILEQQYDDSILKLITCYPVGTTRDRMIILAKKVEN